MAHMAGHTEYSLMVDTCLRAAPETRWTALDLFAGCGGLALGFEAVGFRTIGYEIDQDCVATYKRNLRGDCHNVYLEPGFEYPTADVIIGGPPCQPFSVSGLQLGLADSRDGFPAFIDAVRSVQPKLFLFENVRGMFYRNKHYLQEIIDALGSLGYQIHFKLLNAVDYEVPQNRERLVVVGSRGTFLYPKIHSRRTTAGEALGDLASEAPEDGKYLTPSMDAYVARYEEKSKCVTPRDLHLDRPARTLTCRNLAGATGDMHRVRLPDGRRRRLTPKEAARLQSFPDWFLFEGAEQSVYNQIGNAVAPLFARHLAAAVEQSLLALEEGGNEERLLADVLF